MAKKIQERGAGRRITSGIYELTRAKKITFLLISKLFPAFGAGFETRHFGTPDRIKIAWLQPWFIIGKYKKPEFQAKFHFVPVIFAT